jgi:7-cyano-7-deazaguanine reductase
MQDNFILGQSIAKTEYIQQYNPSLLFPIPRSIKREELGIINNNVFFGVDIWNAYEFSWLNAKGKPQVAIIEFIFSADSINIIESKSFKLYLNSFNQTKFNSIDEIKHTLQKDLKNACQGMVSIKIIQPHEFDIAFKNQLVSPQGLCLDRLDIEIEEYNPNTSFLKLASQDKVEEVLYSNLLKSNCLVTGQPDWASVQIGYSGCQIEQEGLLKYLIGFRNHQEFHEQCVERIFCDIMKTCKPSKLYVYAQYTRRGGLDINPFRSNTNMHMPAFKRHARQ